jgi:hypothetical protein
MEITLNTTPATPADLAAFEAEYAEWNASVEASIPPEEPSLNEDGEPVLEADDLEEWCNPALSEGYEDDCPMDGDAESALASAGFGTDEDYGYYGDDSW